MFIPSKNNRLGKIILKKHILIVAIITIRDLSLSHTPKNKIKEIDNNNVIYKINEKYSLGE